MDRCRLSIPPEWKCSAGPEVRLQAALDQRRSVTPSCCSGKGCRASSAATSMWFQRLSMPSCRGDGSATQSISPESWQHMLECSTTDGSMRPAHPSRKGHLHLLELLLSGRLRSKLWPSDGPSARGPFVTDRLLTPAWTSRCAAGRSRVTMHPPGSSLVDPPE